MNKFQTFKQKIDLEFFQHPVVAANPYTSWFKEGLATEEQVKDLIVQFSVFSNHFILLQAKRMIFAGTEEGERCARNILMNECGVAMDAKTGEVEGRTFSTASAHINWLREIGTELGIAAMDMGRWERASPSTRVFLKGLDKTYGSLDAQIGAGASFAIENWAAFGLGGPQESINFWKELIVGLESFNRGRVSEDLPPLPLGFFRYHFQIESGHGANVWKELEATFHNPDFNARKFLKGGKLALDAIHTFWLGLDEARKKLDAPSRPDLFESINIAQWAV